MRRPEEKHALLRELHEDYVNCVRCPLASPPGRARRHVVFGEGNPDAKVMIVAEAPGYYGDQLGRPVMDDGERDLLDGFLAGVRSSREEVYIALMVMCRPTKEENPTFDRGPTKEEIAACLPRLHRQIDIVDPYVIICLGNAAFKGLTTSKRTLLQVARDKTLPMLWAETPGTFIPVRRTAYATFHPGWLARQYDQLGEERFYARGSDAHHTFLTFHRAFTVADQHAHMNHGTPFPDRGEAQ